MLKIKELKVVEHRNEQFGKIASLRDTFRHQGQSTLNIDTKKKELIGNFKRTGQVYCSKYKRIEH
jgi:hypothetical protein